MDNLIQNATKVSSAEEILAKYFTHNTGKSNLIANLLISPEDCAHLLKLLDQSIASSSAIDFYRNIPLCLLTVWTFSLKYRNTNPEFIKCLEENSVKMPQHHYRLYMDILSNAIDDFSIENFGINHTKSYGLTKVIEAHASVELSESICA